MYVLKRPETIQNRSFRLSNKVCQDVFKLYLQYVRTEVNVWSHGSNACQPMCVLASCTPHMTAPFSPNLIFLFSPECVVVETFEHYFQ
jgi:hypothetical protein